MSMDCEVRPGTRHLQPATSKQSESQKCIGMLYNKRLKIGLHLTDICIGITSIPDRPRGFKMSVNYTYNTVAAGSLFQSGLRKLIFLYM